MRSSWGISDILFLIAIVCFVLAAIGLEVNISLVALGLAFGFGGFLASNRGVRAP